MDKIFACGRSKEKDLKKVCIALLFISCLFALLFELTGSDPNHEWSLRSYLSYVTTNIKPFPTVSFDGDVFADTKQILTYVFHLIDCVLGNIRVFLVGFFPVSWNDIPVGESGGGGVFGNFGGGGFGGGGGGAR